MYDTAAVDAMCGLVAGLREQIVKMHICRRELNARIAEIEMLSEEAAVAADRLSTPDTSNAPAGAPTRLSQTAGATIDEETHIEAVLADIAKDVPDEEWDKLPRDLTDNLDGHYEETK